LLLLNSRTLGINVIKILYEGSNYDRRLKSTKEQKVTNADNICRTS